MSIPRHVLAGLLKQCQTYNVRTEYQTNTPSSLSAPKWNPCTKETKWVMQYFILTGVLSQNPGILGWAVGRSPFS